ncbi:patatin-like phospholipase family protein [Leptospira idonii]|uniref:Patatin-like phospholipase family protein n=1 Tax=Leptospira idonii TaxID=1193500 RepID=A0A4R9LYB8_9LEPT|nr:patatin-like phospholipase family protein [Leptospira idonii]TGN19313.1 patatin-like phospholipase family protein [Leptospira idonii]
MSRKKALVLSGGGARGSYQAGVWRYLEEIGWKPDIICGTSVGAINASAIGSGIPGKELTELWLDLDREKVMLYSWKNAIKELFRKKYAPLASTAPLRELILEKLNLDALNRSETKVVLSAVNILTAELKFFENPDIRVEHILASSAIPLFFPWQMIEGEPYWDGGVMANTPILPAVTRGAEELIVVLLSPVGGSVQMKVPKNKDEALERLYELYLLGSYRNIEQGIEFQKEKSKHLSPVETFLLHFRGLIGDTKIHVIAPKELLGLGSFLNFTREQAEVLIEQGYEDAKEYFLKIER